MRCAVLHVFEKATSLLSSIVRDETDHGAFFVRARMTDVVVDTNAAENLLADLIVAHGTPVERRRLDVGDVMIRNEDVCVFFERKTWGDLRASILDGRWREQKARMLDTGDEQGLRETFVYVVEGAPPRWDSEETRFGVAEKTLLSALARAQMRDGVKVFHTSDSSESALLVCYMHGQICKGEFTKSTTERRAGLSAKRRKRDNIESPRESLVAMLCALPGISFNVADAISSKFATMRLLSTASLSDISEVRLSSGRRVGPAVAKRLFDVLTS
jgi:ERCC4-type nuclease